MSNEPKTPGEACARAFAMAYNKANFPLVGFPRLEFDDNDRPYWDAAAAAAIAQHAAAMRRCDDPTILQCASEDTADAAIARLVLAERLAERDALAARVKSYEERIAKLVELFDDAHACNDACMLGAILAWVDPADHGRNRQMVHKREAENAALAARVAELATALKQCTDALEASPLGARRSEVIDAIVAGRNALTRAALAGGEP